MAGLSPYAGRIGPFIPGCIGRGTPGVNPPQPQPAQLATGAVDMGDGTGALLTAPTWAHAASITSGGSTALRTGVGILGQAVVTTAPSLATTFFDSATGSSGLILGIIPSNAAIGAIYTWNMPCSNGIVQGGGATGLTATISWS